MKPSILTMDISTSNCYQSQSMFTTQDPLFEDTFTDPLCKLNLKESSEFVNTFPMLNHNNNNISAQKRRESLISVNQKRLEAPPTPGRPVFSFSIGNFARKSFPSKWDDAEKWLNSSNESPAHAFKPSKPHLEVFSEKCSVSEVKNTDKVSAFQNCHDSTSSEVLLKDKFTDKAEQINPTFGYSELRKEGFLFDNSAKDNATRQIVQHRDMGTTMSPLFSSPTSRNHTPYKIPSPARHNTPQDRSGPLGMIAVMDIAQLQECHLAKLQLGTQYGSVTSIWSSREEEEEEVSKSFRHNFAESRAAVWDWQEEERTKHCHRYQREEARIQAWLNLQSAKAEAQSRKLEVKIQKMRSNMEEKLMKRMAAVHRKAEEWRAAAQVQHWEQTRNEQALKAITRHNPHLSAKSGCGCLTGINNHY